MIYFSKHSYIHIYTKRQIMFSIITKTNFLLEKYITRNDKLDLEKQFNQSCKANPKEIIRNKSHVLWLFFNKNKEKRLTGVKG